MEVVIHQKVFFFLLIYVTIWIEAKQSLNGFDMKKGHCQKDCTKVPWIYAKQISPSDSLKQHKEPDTAINIFFSAARVPQFNKRWRPTEV